MLYAITGRANDLHLTPEQFIEFAGSTVKPSLQMLAGWEAAGKIKGGVWSGYRGGTLIMDAPSHDEVNQLLLSLPFWGFHEWNIVPLISWNTEVKQLDAQVEAIRKMLGK